MKTAFIMCAFSTLAACSQGSQSPISGVDLSGTGTNNGLTYILGHRYIGQIAGIYSSSNPNNAHFDYFKDAGMSLDVELLSQIYTSVDDAVGVYVDPRERCFDMTERFNFKTFACFNTEFAFGQESFDIQFFLVSPVQGDIIHALFTVPTRSIENQFSPIYILDRMTRLHGLIPIFTLQLIEH